MNGLPQTHTGQRAPRIHLVDLTPAVLRFQNGQRTSGQLQVLSLTGGLLSLSTPLHQGSQVKLLFLTGAGPVLGGAEMLTPVNHTLQPFRFVSLPVDDRRRLGTAIQTSLDKTAAQDRWIAKLRAASSQVSAPRRTVFKVVLGAVGLVALSIASAMFLSYFRLLK